MTSNLDAMGQWARIKHDVMFLEEVRQVAVPVGRQTTTVFGRVRQNAAPGAKSAIYDYRTIFEHEPQVRADALRRRVVIGYRSCRPDSPPAPRLCNVQLYTRLLCIISPHRQHKC